MASMPKCYWSRVPSPARGEKRVERAGMKTMAKPHYVLLEDRSILAVAGEDRRDFLQGLISNDVNKVAAGRAIHAALLTPQGKYLHDFFIAELAETLLLDCEGGRLADLKRRLALYKLRSKVALEERGEAWVVAALFGDGIAPALGLGDDAGTAVPFAGGVVFVDPRLAAAGARAIVPREDAAPALKNAGFEAATAADYDALRLGLGLPDGSRDLPVDKAILLENGFDELGSVDWNKGCYMGQELTARTKYRALIKKRLVPVTLDGPAPEPGTPILLEGKDAGEMRSARDSRGLALMRLEALEQAAKSGSEFTVGMVRVSPHKPDWADF